MRFHTLASLAVFALAATAALPARADVSPPCEPCILSSEGGPCTDPATSKAGTCVKDTSGACALTCVVGSAASDAGAGGGGSGTSDTGGGCSAAGAVGATGTVWLLAAIPLFLRRRRAARR
jgi:hypothetical protein